VVPGAVLGPYEIISLLGAHVFPVPLPGGSAVLFTVSSRTSGPPQIALQDLESGDRKILYRGGASLRYLASGHLVYVVNGVVHCVTFDPKTRTVTGTPVPMLRQVAMLGPVPMLDVAANGTLVYSPGNTSRLPVWVDRNGGELRSMRQPTGIRRRGFRPTAGGSHTSTFPAAANMTSGSWTSNEEPWIN
jgi:hypothetical protein